MKTLTIFIGICVCLALGAGAAPVAAGKVLWRDPGPIASRDLYWGSGSDLRAPKPPFTFVSEDTSGTKPKLDVTDATGVAWSVKLQTGNPAENEVHAEIAASRILWSMGYFADENYYVAEGRMDNVGGLKRAAPFVGADGSFGGARFERRGKELVWRGEWDLEKNNPFIGTRELSGLQMLTLIIGNWDVNPHNDAIVRVRLDDNTTEDRYLIADLGSSFGQVKGGVNEKPTRWNLTDYTSSKLLSGVVQGKLTFRGPIQGNQPLQIPLDHARWFVGMSSQLTGDQMRRAFEASGASPAEVEGFSAQVMKRLQELADTVKVNSAK